MKRLIYISALTLVFSAKAEVVLRQGNVKVSDPDQLRAFLKSVDRESNETVCLGVEEIPGAYLCQSSSQKLMNDTLTRMGFFMGAAKGLNYGTIMNNDDRMLKMYKNAIAGHNLPGDVIEDFYLKVSDLNSDEASFKTGFVDKLSDTNIYVIGTSIEEKLDAKKTVSHEIYHAQYGLNPNYKRIVDAYWDIELSVSERGEVRTILGVAYNTNDGIIIDEFQAYVLEQNAETTGHLKGMAIKHGAALRKRLTDAGVAPVIIQ